MTIAAGFIGELPDDRPVFGVYSKYISCALGQELSGSRNFNNEGRTIRGIISQPARSPDLFSGFFIQGYNNCFFTARHANKIISVNKRRF